MGPTKLFVKGPLHPRDGSVREGLCWLYLGNKRLSALPVGRFVLRFDSKLEFTLFNRKERNVKHTPSQQRMRAQEGGGDRGEKPAVREREIGLGVRSHGSRHLVKNTGGKESLFSRR